MNGVYLFDTCNARHCQYFYTANVWMDKNTVSTRSNFSYAETMSWTPWVFRKSLYALTLVGMCSKHHNVNVVFSDFAIGKHPFLVDLILTPIFENFASVLLAFVALIMRPISCLFYFWMLLSTNVPAQDSLYKYRNRIWSNFI